MVGWMARERTTLKRIKKEVPLPPGWKWVMVVGEPAVEGPERQYRDEHSWLTWHKDASEWTVRIVPVGYKNAPGWYENMLVINTGSTDIVDAAKLLANYVYLGMVSP